LCFEYAQKPENAFPPLEWEPCPGNGPGCERLVRNWPQAGPLGLGYPLVRRSGAGYELALVVVYPELEQRVVIVNEDGITTAAYHTIPGTICQLTRPGLSNAGHWAGVQELGLAQPSRYVFQPRDQSPASALIAPTTTLSQFQRGGNDLLSLQLDFGKGLEIFDRTTELVHTTPATLLGADVPRLVDDAAFFLGYPDYNKPEVWVWTRASGAYQELIDRNPGHVADVQADGQTLLWIETPPKTEPGPWPAGTLYTSPYTTDAGAVAGTARRPMPAIEPGAWSAMSEGYYAVWGSTTTYHVVRISDAQLWTVSIPMDEWQALLDDVSYVDATYVFYKTDTHVYRQRLDALGPGQPAN
jgi:hypothetical protein